MAESRIFPPGSEWLYAKVYMGYYTADQLLAEVIGPQAEAWQSQGWCTKWFFIRYADPDPHLRLRFYHPDRKEVLKILPALQSLLQEYMEDDLIWKVQIDTYQREIERYGAQTITLSEDLFHLDSQQAVAFLGLIEGPEGEEIRWLFALKAMDSLLHGFEIPLEGREKLLAQLRETFALEFNMERSLKRQLDQKYRDSRGKISQFIENPALVDGDFEVLNQLLAKTQVEARPIIAQLISHTQAADSQVGLFELLGSYLHMLNNRLFSSNNRTHELVCYDFLHRHYQSTLARKD